MQCVTCGKEFKEEKGKNNKPYKNCPNCRKSMMNAGHTGGSQTAATHGKEFYQQIGKKGGSTVKALIAEAKANRLSATVTPAAVQEAPVKKGRPKKSA